MQETRRRVLEALADGPVTGPALADRLDVSRAAVWKHVEALREAGFEVEGGEDGYELSGVPEFGGAAVELGLDADLEVEYRESLASTNATARERAAEGATDLVVLADRQTGGQARLDREWASPPGGIYCSILFRPDVPPAHAPVFTMAAAVAVTRAAREVGVDACIKWPNDVLVPAGTGAGRTKSDDALVETDDGEAKLCGILTEMEGEADRVSWIVVGIGVNANVDAADLPPEATSLQAQVGRVDRRSFLQRLLAEFDDLRADPEAVLPAWREHALTLGQRVRVETPGGEVVGQATDVEFPGALLVETDDGTVRVSAGDCEHLRPV